MSELPLFEVFAGWCESEAAKLRKVPAGKMSWTTEAENQAVGLCRAAGMAREIAASEPPADPPPLDPAIAREAWPTPPREGS